MVLVGLGVVVEDALSDLVAAVAGAAAAAADDAGGAPDLHARLALHQRAAVHRHRHRHARTGGPALHLRTDMTLVEIEIDTLSREFQKVAREND